VIGIGLRETVSRGQLRAAALDGSIEDLLDWRSVKAGDVFYSPAGTVHAIGPGLTLVEVQQNVDLTYRLYDYGRPRELHLDEGIAVSDPVPYVTAFIPEDIAPGRRILADGPAFVFEHWTGGADMALTPEGGRPLLLMPLAGAARIDGEPLVAGTVWSVDGTTSLATEGDSDLLVAYPGGGVIPGLRG
jgi:mannose-6-phosphate isomerase